MQHIEDIPVKKNWSKHIGPKIQPGADSDPDYEDNVAEAEEDYEFLEQLLQSRQMIHSGLLIFF